MYRLSYKPTFMLHTRSVVPKLGVATHTWVACRYFGGRVILYIV